jgi:putative DNA primase/helicase
MATTMRKQRPGADVRKQQAAVDREDFDKSVHFDAAGDLAQACDDTLRIAVAQGVPLYQHAGRLVKVVVGEDDRRPNKHVRRDPLMPRIFGHDDASLADELTRQVMFYRRNRKTGEYQRCDCPTIIARTIIARRDWPGVPYLTAVVEHPVVLPDGRLLSESGLDVDTGLLLVLPPYSFHVVDEHLGLRDCAVALDSLRELLSGFPFESDLDLSVTLSFLLTFFARSVLPTAPLFAWTAPAPGSGKSLIARIGSRMASGREPAFMVAPEDPAELGKALFALLLEGDEHIAIDNVVLPIAGAHWAVVSTSPVYRGRILGQSATVSVPTASVISLNGNNLQIVDDMTRRVLVASLDPACDRPAEREFEFDPLQELDDCRADYVHAALVIMCAYLRSGERVDVRPFGSFETWSRMVREPLVWLGLPDPVDSIRSSDLTLTVPGHMDPVLARRGCVGC